MHDTRLRSEILFEQHRFLVSSAVFCCAFAFAAFFTAAASSYDLGWRIFSLVVGVPFSWMTLKSIKESFSVRKLAYLWQDLENDKPGIPAEVRELYQTILLHRTIIERGDADLAHIRKSIVLATDKIEAKLLQ